MSVVLTREAFAEFRSSDLIVRESEFSPANATLSFGFKRRSKGPGLGECNQEPLGECLRVSYKGGPFGSGEKSAKKVAKMKKGSFLKNPPPAICWKD